MIKKNLELNYGQNIDKKKKKMKNFDFYSERARRDTRLILWIQFIKGDNDVRISRFIMLICVNCVLNIDKKNNF